MKHNNQIHGIGNDIIAIGRIQQSIERQGDALLSRLLSVRELEYCNRFSDPIPHIAGRFAAKEAVVKALGTGFGAEVRWHDIEIINESSGKPIVVLAHHLEERLQGSHILISISHCTEFATAVALWVS